MVNFSREALLHVTRGEVSINDNCSIIYVCFLIFFIDKYVNV